MTSRSRFAAVVVAALMALITIGPRVAWAEQPEAPTVPGMSGVVPKHNLTSEGAAVPRPLRTIEGSVQIVDRAAGAVHLAWGPFGVLRKLIEVTAVTEIEVDGHPGGLGDLRKGMEVKASYEPLDGKNLAIRISTVPGPGDRATSSRSSGTGQRPLPMETGGIGSEGR